MKKEKSTTIIKKHITVLFIIFSLLLLCLIVGIPSLAKIKNRNTIYNASSWDGTVALSYKSGDGTKDNPYIISNGSEYAFFLQDTDYEGKYFRLGGDIIINDGIFNYSESSGITYTKKGIKYYVKENTNEYYDNILYSGSPVGKLNKLDPIENFNGNLDGDSFTIYGLYMYNTDRDSTAIFENLNGNINDIYINNSMIYGAGNIAGIAINADNSTLNNVLLDGTVINKSEFKTSQRLIDPISVDLTDIETTTTIDIIENTVKEGIKGIKLLGEFVSTEETALNTMYINGFEITNNNFEINLGQNDITQLNITASTDTIGTQLRFTNLKLVTEYYDDLTSGIVVNANNLSLTNVINKSDIYGNYLASGFVSQSKGTLNIKNSYNNGNINSTTIDNNLFIGSGIVGKIENNEKHTTILNSYNNGSINSNLASSFLAQSNNNTGIINIEKCINYTPLYSLGIVQNSNVNIVDSYSINELTAYIGNTVGNFENKEETELYNKESLNKLGYKEYVNLNSLSTNPENIWIFEKDSYPILYIDDINVPVANLNLSKYSWNNLSDSLNTFNIANNIVFSIEDVSITNPSKEKYYYVSNSRVPMSREELDSIKTWSEYQNMVTIEESGYYVIYAKIVDMDEKITYINSDIMVLNATDSQAGIVVNEKTWSEYKEDLKTITLTKDINVTLYATSDLNEITSMEYYISNEKKSKQELDNINEWTSYTSPILITEYGKYIIYAKIVDSTGTIKYINTDYLEYNGYIQNLNLGISNINYNSNYITYNSSLSINFESNFEIKYEDGYTHSLVSSILLPSGTKITLIDRKNGKIYKLNINTDEDLYGYHDSCNGVSNCSKTATYEFSELKDITSNSYYKEESNKNTMISNEKFTIILDFKDAAITDNYYDVSFYLSLKDKDKNILYKSLDKTIDNISIYSNLNNTNINTQHELVSNYENQSIYLNSNSDTTITFEDKIYYSSSNEKNIIDTNYERKESGIIISLYNQNNEQLNKNYINNILFIYDGAKYYAENKNYIQINLGSVTEQKLKELTVRTKENNGNLENGTYYIKIQKYISDNGYMYDDLYKDELIIPLIIENQETAIVEHNFNVYLDKESIIIDKSKNEHLATVNISYSEVIINPNVRISLYEKLKQTAYNQEYKLVDLKEYITNQLNLQSSNKYFVPTNGFVLNLNPKKFNNNGYKYVFELYDGDIKITEIEKYFISK